QLSTQNYHKSHSGSNEDDNFRDRCQKNIQELFKSYPQFSKHYKPLGANEIVFIWDFFPIALDTP
ncbi:MAG: hypothetical protein ACNS64_00710, partial [Candidatus Halalkalibacterium sp. M3_1C_030]